MTEHEPRQPSSDSQREALEEAVTAYQQALEEDASAVRYLLARGIEESTALTHRLGVVGEPAPGHEPYRGRLAIPYLHRSGYPLAVRFRCIAEHDCKATDCRKYLTVSGEPSRMFNTAAIFEADDEIHVTEGEIDAMILGQLGLPAVAIPGANNWAGHHRRMLAGFSRVWVWADPDQAGAEFLNKVTRSLRSAKGVRLRDGDVNETYLQGGAEAIYNLIERKA